MFALAAYDAKERTLFLARDRIGEKPLYYGFVGQAFVFASEINAITALAGFDNPINTAVLSLYFIHGYIPAPSSIYKGSYKLEAGTVLEIKAPFSDYATYPYWSITEVAAYGQSHIFKGSRIEAADELERLLKVAIREHMIADVPVGAFMSAGIDSTTVVALMQSLLTGKVKSFTIGMPAYINDEAVPAKRIAAHLGVDHIVRYISKEDVKAIIPQIGAMYGEPFADSSQMPTYLVSKVAREQVTVSLSGDGGDELFCGYDFYRVVMNAWRKSRRPRKKSTAEIYIGMLDYDPLFRKISLTDKDIPYKHNELPYRFFTEPNHQLMLMDMLLYHPDDILVKVDRAAMAVSLETRVPLLDKDVVEFAWSLPIEYKLDGKVRKSVLRDVLYRYVPRELMAQPKQGFGIPIDRWLLEPDLRSWAEQLLSRDSLVQQGLLNPDTVGKIWDGFVTKGRFISQIWYILMFQDFMARSKRLPVAA
jgi:asparagine synthase (glutamine-hydrolysing)